MKLSRSIASATALLTTSLALVACGSDDQEPNSAGGGAAGDSTSSAGAGDAGNSSGGIAGGVAGGMAVAAAGAAGDDSAGAAGDSSCVPRGCAELGACGGQIADGCGHSLQCPPCSDICTRESSGGFARRAHSANFSGTDTEYAALFNTDCASTSACNTACVAAGGTSDLCSASECIMSVQNYCLTPPVWVNLDAATVQGNDPEVDGATLVLVAQPYHDQLLLDHFQLELPDDARIRGIELKLRRASDFPASAADNGIRLMKAGHVGSVDRSAPEQWPAGDFQEQTYGGPTDLWGETWTVAALEAADFGVALSAKYTQAAGNARAYVDFIRIKVYYDVNCQLTP